MLIAEMEKNPKEKIRVSIEEYRGSTFVDLRVYWQDEAGEWKPSRKGIALSDECIDEVIEALRKASKKLEG
jgi:predicted SpoU family rRNA methylase